MRGAAGLLAALALAVSAGSALAAEEGLNARVRANPLRAVLQLETGQANAGIDVQATATLANIGQVTLRDALLRLRVDAAISVHPSRPRGMARLTAGRTVVVQWRVCPTEPGNYVLFIEATAAGADGSIYVAESPAVVLEVHGQAAQRCRGGRPGPVQGAPAGP